MDQRLGLQGSQGRHLYFILKEEELNLCSSKNKTMDCLGGVSWVYKCKGDNWLELFISALFLKCLVFEYLRTKDALNN